MVTMVICDNRLFVLKVDQGKKRANESASKTPVSSKKSKNATPEKTGETKLYYILFLFSFLSNWTSICFFAC